MSSLPAPVASNGGKRVSEGIPPLRMAFSSVAREPASSDYYQEDLPSSGRLWKPLGLAASLMAAANRKSLVGRNSTTPPVAFPVFAAAAREPAPMVSRGVGHRLLDPSDSHLS